MKTRNLFLIILLFGPIFNCLAQNDKSNEVRTFDLTEQWNSEDNYSLSKIGSQIEYIRLETSPSCMLDRAQSYRPVIYDSKIILIKRDSPIYVFDLNGKFLNKIGAIGKGPTEFVNASSFAFDHASKNIWICDSRQSKMLIFSLDGEFVSSFEIEQGYSRIFTNSQGTVSRIYSTYRGESGLPVIQNFNIKGEIIDAIPLYEGGDKKKRPMLISLSSIFIEDDNLHLIEEPYNQEYIYQDGKWVRSCVFRVQGQSKAPREHSNPVVGNGIVSIRQSKDYFFIDAYNTMKYFIVEKRSGKVTKCTFSVDAVGLDQTGAYNDLDGGLPFWPRSITNDGDLVSIYDSYNVMSYALGQSGVYGGKRPVVDKSFLDMANKLSIDDNPVVVRVRVDKK